MGTHDRIRTFDSSEPDLDELRRRLDRAHTDLGAAHAQFLRLKARRGAKKAIGAVAASILTAAYHMLSNGTAYRDLGPHHFDRQDKGARARRLLRRLRDLGYIADITPIANTSTAAVSR